MLHGWCISSTAQLSGMRCGWCGMDKRPPIKVAERHRDLATVASASQVWNLVIIGRFLVAELSLVAGLSVADAYPASPQW